MDIWEIGFFFDLDVMDMDVLPVDDSPAGPCTHDRQRIVPYRGRYRYLLPA